MTHKYQAHYDYILAHIDGSGYGIEFENDADKIKFLAETFRAEYGWSIDRHGPFKALQEWLSGLPSAIDLPFYNHDILAYAVETGGLPKDYTDKQADRILETWFAFMAMRIFELLRKHGEFA